jgi:hypothetical protein
LRTTVRWYVDCFLHRDSSKLYLQLGNYSCLTSMIEDAAVAVVVTTEPRAATVTRLAASDRPLQSNPGCSAPPAFNEKPRIVLPHRAS